MFNSCYGKPSIITLIAAVFNLIIVLGTLRRILSPVHPLRTYSYLSDDYPLEMPLAIVPTVEMTFSESTRFSLSNDSSSSSSSSSSDADWKTLYTKIFGTGFHHIGPYQFRFITGAYHSLHCVYKMHVALDKPNHLEHQDHHYVHCLMYLQQIFLCNADMTLEAGDFMARNMSTDRVGPTRRCRDWATAEAWIESNFREWAESNGLHLPA